MEGREGSIGGSNCTSSSKAKVHDDTTYHYESCRVLHMTEVRTM